MWLQKRGSAKSSAVLSGALNVLVPSLADPAGGGTLPPGCVLRHLVTKPRFLPLDFGEPRLTIVFCHHSTILLTCPRADK